MRAAASLGQNAFSAAVGVVADLVFGEPGVEPHPVSAFGAVMGRVEGTLYRPRRSAGVLHAVTGMGVGIAAGSLVRSTALATYVAVAQRALCEAGREVAAALRDGDVDRARSLLPTLVGRDPSGLDAAEISRAVVESLAENTVDAVVAPGILGRSLRSAGNTGLPRHQHDGRHCRLPQ